MPCTPPLPHNEHTRDKYTQNIILSTQELMPHTHLRKEKLLYELNEI